MNQLPDIDAAVHAAVDGLTQEQRRVFSDELSAQFLDGAPARSDAATALECAWQLASSRLLSDPLDPIGAAWERFAAVLFSRTEPRDLRGEPHAQA